MALRSELHVPPDTTLRGMHARTVTSSTYHPSSPLHPSMPRSNRRRIVSPGATPSAPRSICDCPQVLWSSPPSVPLNAGCPASGFVLPAAAGWSAMLYGLNVKAAGGTSVYGPPLTLIFTLPPSQPASVAT